MPRRIAYRPSFDPRDYIPAARRELFERIGLPEPFRQRYRDISAATARPPSPEYPEGLAPISRQHIANVLLGKSEAKSGVLERLAEVGGIPVDKLLECFRRLWAEGTMQGAVTSRKLSESEVKDIRAKRAAGQSCREIAADNDVSRETVSRVTRVVPRSAVS